MDAGRYMWIAVLLALPAAAGAGEVVPLAVRAGRCECVLPAGRGDDKYFLIIGALARAAGPHPVRIQCRPTSAPAYVPVEPTLADPDWSGRVNEWRLLLERSRSTSRQAEPVVAPPARERPFRLPSGLTTGDKIVQARLGGVGRHCQVYLDCQHDEPAADAVAEIIRVFDEQVLPLSERLLGRADDVDGDGRFTILLTPRLGGIGGLVSRDDFNRAGPGNRADLMYLHAGLRPGPHLRTLLAHEYTHAVVYRGDPPRAEEDWLNEAVAHVAEEAHGHGWSNLDHRLAAYLQAPERFPLVAADHRQAGLYRCPGHRGAAYLFLRHCTRRHGPDLLRRLVQTPLVGVANLEVATGEPFAELFRAWSASAVSVGPRCSHTTLKVADPARRLTNLFAAESPPPLELAGLPRYRDLPLTGGQVDLELAGTAVGYVLLHSPGQRGSRLIIVGDPAAELQISLVRLPPGTPRLSLRAIGESGQLRLALACHDADATLTAAGGLDQPLAAHTARAWFGNPRWRAGETRYSVPLPPGVECQTIRIAAESDGGLRWTSWCAPAQPPAGWAESQ